MDSPVLIFFTLLFSAFFSGLEIAFISSNKLMIEVDKNKGQLSGRLLSELNKTPSHFIGSLLLGNNIALVIYGICMANLLEPPLERMLPASFGTPFWILLIQSILSTIIILIAGEFLPKTLFRINPNRILRVFAVPAYVFYYIFYPVIILFTRLSEKMLKGIFGLKIVNEDYVFTTIDLDNYIKEFIPPPQSETEMEPEIQMFQNAIDFRNIKVRECMVPRTEIIGLEENNAIEELIALHIESGHSKLFIYRNSIDHIIGYTHSFDLFSQPKNIAEILKPIQVVPETMFANQALQILIRERTSVALVVDEFGGTSGMVTMEDIIEEIFGEIKDEFDVDKLTERQISKNEYLFSGRLEIDYLNEKYKLNLPVEEEYETLAGLILHHHESIPELNDEIMIDPFILNIVQASENRIKLVRLKVKN